MLRLQSYELDTNFSLKYINKTTIRDVQYSDKNIIPRVEKFLKHYVESSRNVKYLNKELIVNALRLEYSEYNRKPWGVMANLIARALVVVDNQGKENMNDHNSISSDDSTINIMSSGEESVDITNDFDPIESLNPNITEVNNSSSESTHEMDIEPGIVVDVNQTTSNGARQKTVKNISREVNNQSGWVTTPAKKLKREIEHLNKTVDGMPTPLKKVFQLIGSAEEVNVNFDNLAGCDSVLLEICQLIMHIKHPEVYKTLGVSPPKGFLLHGPPGCGKTLLAQAVAGELKIPLISIAAPQLVVGISGESEKRVRKLFESAVKSAPCVLFIDEVDSISPNRDNTSRDMERRIVAQLLSSLDSLKDDDKVIVIGATNRPDSLDPALRRAGRFDREVCLGIPDRQSRRAMLDLMCKELRIAPSVTLDRLSELTPGFVGADLKSLTREAATVAANRTIEEIKNRLNYLNGEKPNETEIIPKNKILDTLNLLRSSNIIPKEELGSIKIELDDFKEALKKVVPSSKREGFVTVPNITWDDIGSLKKIRQELHMAMLAPVTHAKEFTALGLDVPTGVLLCGPPGCGKTLLAKAVANEAGINFISIKGPELLNMYVGESERGVRQCFQRARNSQPCVIFFDEIDALCPKRSDMDASGRSGQRVVNQLLTEMDGFEGGRSGGVFVMGATNRPDMIDPAVLRPGRLDKVLYVGLPDDEGRVDILRAITKAGTKPILACDVDLEVIGKNEKCNNFTGADLAALVREAGIICLEEYITSTEENKQLAIQNKHFDEALLKIRPSVSPEDRIRYEILKLEYAAPRS
ncbi:nuclear valosin-containing protein-like [Daktulosphaira vitifoliae]|uniref:nuclear valosin-containing protein-like n=1 Tax=Daktulosphaira vitifoliae TaxID=58002 RepID=UPI0021AA2101|nr:nuclear valosin-containing protein-like [Daktulosphaira vitifoliae]